MVVSGNSHEQYAVAMECQGPESMRYPLFLWLAEQGNRAKNTGGTTVGMMANAQSP
jgi:hypothetical protein